MRRLADDARALLEDASAVARKYRHVEVDPEHLLAAAVAGTRHEKTLARRGFDSGALGAVVGAVLADKEQVGAYRDGRTPTESARLRRFASSACGRKKLVDLFTLVSAEQLVDALVCEPEILPLALRAPRRIADAGVAAVLARALASSRYHSVVTLRHFALVLTSDPSVVDVCAETAATELDLVRERLDRNLAPLAAGFVGTDPGHDVRRFFFSRGIEDASDEHYAINLFAQILGEEEVADLFDDPHPDAPPTLAVIRALGVGPPPIVGDEAAVLAGAHANDALVDVVFFDDDTTTMELVVEILHECFDLSSSAATAAMLTIHKRGHHAVATLPAHEAKHRVGIARARAAAAGMPLRIGIRVVDDV